MVWVGLCQLHSPWRHSAYLQITLDGAIDKLGSNPFVALKANINNFLLSSPDLGVFITGCFVWVAAANIVKLLLLITGPQVYILHNVPIFFPPDFSDTIFF